MRQYRTAQTRYTYCEMVPDMPHMRGEALLGSSYKKRARAWRRRMNKYPDAWLDKQTNEAGMPWVFHCGGVEQ